MEPISRSRAANGAIEDAELIDFLDAFPQAEARVQVQAQAQAQDQAHPQPQSSGVGASRSTSVESADQVVLATKREMGGEHPEQPTKLKLRRPLMITRASVRFPFLVMLLAMAGPGICIYLAVSVPFDIDVGISGFRVPSEVGATRHDAWKVAKEELQRPDANVTQARQSERAGGISVYYEAVGGNNILTRAHLVALRNFENKIRGATEFDDYCLLDSEAKCAPHYSLLNYFYPSTKEVQVLPGIRVNISVPDGRGRAMVDNITVVLDSLSTDAALADEKKRFFFDRSFTAGNHSSQYTRAVFSLGQPLSGYNSTIDRKFDQRQKQEEWAVRVLTPVLESAVKDLDGFIRLYWRGTGLTENGVLDIVLNDALYAGVSFGFVLVYSTLHTKSLFLTALGLFHILMSFPLTYAIFKFVMGFHYVGVLNFLGLFIVVGIGIDDVFIFVDSFEQAKKRPMSLYYHPNPGTGSGSGSGSDESNLTQRLDFCFRRASKAMLVTSVTTAAAFFANTLSPIPPISQFGSFSGLLIVFNYLLIILWYPSVMVVHERHVLPLYEKLVSKSRPKSTMDEVEVMELAEASKSVVVAPDSQARAASSRIPSISNPKSILPDGIGDDYHGHSPSPSPSSAEELSRMNSLSPAMIAKYRWLERFCYNRLAPTVHKFRFGLCIVFVLLLLQTGWWGLQMEPDSEFSRLLPDDAPFQRYMDLSEYVFPVMDTTGYSNPFFDLHLVYGIEGLDRSAANPEDLYDLGRPVFDPTFNITDPAAQLHLVATCLDAMKQTAYAKQKDFDCVMLNFKNWTLGLNQTFPVASGEFVSRMKTFLGEQPRFAKYVGLDDDNIKFTYFSFNSTLPRKQPSSIATPHFKFWEDFVAKANLNGPPTLNKLFCSSHWWAVLNTEDALLSAALVNALVSIGIAFVILTLSSANMVIGLLSTLSICGIVLTVLACMVWMGWHLGVVESVALTTVVGLAVDFTVHLSVAYHDGLGSFRFVRARQATLDLGISVISSGITSAGAALPLALATTVIFFTRFGIFMAVTIVASLVFALVFFVALLMVFGPEAPKEHGSIVNMMSMCRL